MFVDGNIFPARRYLFVLMSLLFTLTVFAAETELQLENELLLELRLEGKKLGVDILGYQRGDEFLLSLDEISSGLGFAITVDGEKGIANGWYISEERQFSLDIDNGTVVSDGKQIAITDKDVVKFENGLFVETQALEKWFPLRMAAVVRELYLDVQPEELLPLQQRMIRRDRSFTRPSSSREPKHPLQHTPYTFFSPHLTKLRLGYSTTRKTPNSSADYKTNYASLSRGDLGWMTSTLSLSGQFDDSISAARLKLERTAFNGPMGINHIEIGDVEAGGFRGMLMRGGGSDKRGARFDSEGITIEGSQLPDWDVELYQNDQLIDIQTTGADGRYIFENMALVFGENRFTLKFYGPNGETESREEYYNLGLGMLEPGQIGYELAAVQNGRTVFGVNDVDAGEDRNLGIYTGDVNFGLTRNMTMGAGVRSATQNGIRRVSSNIGLGFTTSLFFGNVRYVDIPEDQNSVYTSLRTRVSSTNISVGYTQFFKDSELNSNAKKWTGNIGITSSLYNFPLKFEINTNVQNESTLVDAVFGTTLPLLGTGQFATSLWYGSSKERVDNSINKESRTGGQSSFNAVLKPWSFRFSTNYSLTPESELLNLSADSRLRIERDLSLDLSVRKNQTTDTTSYTGGINWQLDQVAINARVSYDSNERWGGIITLSSTLAHQRGTLMPIFDSRASINSGSVEVRVFEESSENERKPHAGVRVNGVQAWRHATTDKNGFATITNLTSHRQQDIELDETTLSEIELKSSNPGVSVIPRPGSYAVVDFPIIRTVELEGHVLTDNGMETTPVSRALVSLKTLDGDIVAQVRTAFDGFYLFDGVESGVYQLTLAESLAQRVLSRPENVNVDSTSGLIQGLDFSLSAKAARTLSLNETPQEGMQTQQSVKQPKPPIPELIARLKPEVKKNVPQKVNEGSWFVQLGAYGSRKLAEVHWGRVEKSKAIFRDKIPRYFPHQKMTRLLVGPGQTRDAATELCRQVMFDGMDCIVRNVD